MAHSFWGHQSMILNIIDIWVLSFKITNNIKDLKRETLYSEILI